MTRSIWQLCWIAAKTIPSGCKGHNTPSGEGFYFVALRIVYILPHHLVKGMGYILCSLNRRKEALDKPSNLSYHHNKFQSTRKRILAGFDGDAFFDPYADHYDEISLWKGWGKQS